MELRAVANAAEVANRDAKVRAVNALSWARVTVWGPGLVVAQKGFHCAAGIDHHHGGVKAHLAAGIDARARDLFRHVERYLVRRHDTLFPHDRRIARGRRQRLRQRRGGNAGGDGDSGKAHNELPELLLSAAYHFRAPPVIRKKALAEAAAQAMAQATAAA
ncbi:MAG TPA: hypothetical protein VLL04_12560 [Rhizomicrobium sp.]|nr:hypothetical protein [Rhizomicrobium sp.]